MVLVIVFDVVEKQRRAITRTLRQAHDGSEFDVPIDLGVDFVDFARFLQRGDPTP